MARLVLKYRRAALYLGIVIDRRKLPPLETSRRRDIVAQMAPSAAAGRWPGSYGQSRHLAYFRAPIRQLEHRTLK